MYQANYRELNGDSHLYTSKKYTAWTSSSTYKSYGARL